MAFKGVSFPDSLRELQARENEESSSNTIGAGTTLDNIQLPAQQETLEPSLMKSILDRHVEQLVAETLKDPEVALLVSETIKDIKDGKIDCTPYRGGMFFPASLRVLQAREKARENEEAKQIAASYWCDVDREPGYIPFYIGPRLSSAAHSGN